MTNHSRRWLLAFALLGLAASSASTYIHYQILRDPAYTSICDINQTFSCESAYLSQYGTIRGVPVALAGLIFFALTSALLLAGGRAARRAAAAGAAESPVDANAAAYVYVLSTAGMGVVLYFAYASFFVLHTLCVFCLLTYVAMIGLFLASGGATEATARSIPGRVWGDLGRLVRTPLALAVAILFTGAAAAALVTFPRDSLLLPTPSSTAAAAGPAATASVSEDQQAAFDSWFDSQPRAALDVPADGAAVVIVKFNDFQCPACSRAYFQHKEVLARYARDYPGAVKFVAVDFPLNPGCNASVSTMVHPAACAGAVAVRLAARQGPDAVLKMEEWLYSNQEGVQPEDVAAAAGELLGITDFDAEYPGVLSEVKRDADMGGRLAIQGTPTFFINGVRIEGSPRAEYLDAAITHELRRAGVIEQP